MHQIIAVIFFGSCFEMVFLIN